MLNREILLSDVRKHMMNKALTMIAEESFFLALPYSFQELEMPEKMGLHEYVSSAIEQFGGADALLKNAIEVTKNDSVKNTYMKTMYAICNESATTVAKRVSEETPDTADYSDAVKAANFTEAEFKKFENNAEKLTLEDVGKIVSEKVIATIKNEQEAFVAEQEIEKEINEAIAANSDDPEGAVESFYQLALDRDDPRHHVSLFSKMVDAAMESLAVMNQDDLNKDLSIKTISDITFVYGLDSYRKEMSATESMERLLTIDANVINSNVFQEVALESLQDPNTAKAGFAAAATAYAFMETMKTLNLHSPNVDEVRRFINSNPTPAYYGNSAVESFVKKADSLFVALESTVRKMNDIVALRDYRNYYEGLSNKLESIGVATESFCQCKASVKAKIETAYTKIDEKIVSLLMTEPEKSNDEKIAFEQDLSALNRIYNIYGKRNDGDHFVIKYDDQKQSSVLEVQYVDAMESPLVSTFIGLESAVNNKNCEKHIASVFAASKFAANGIPVQYKTISGYMTKL